MSEYGVIEERIRAFWDEENIDGRIRKRNAKGEPFYYLDGPPYTSGRIHIGQAWGKTLRDMVLRYKRMHGFDVFDRAGFDMHGLPTSHKVEAKFSLKTREDVERFGQERFTQECKALALENMEGMIEDFKRMGVSLDFSDPYMPINDEYIEGIWWFLKLAYEKDRLYEGLRTLHWDAKDRSALAKHELEYRQVTDTSIFVAFPLKDGSAHLVVWTTTPWTIPFNLGVMVNPDVEYSFVRGGGRTFIIASDRVEDVMRSARIDSFETLRTVIGAQLEGVAYTHPFSDRIDYSPAKSDRIHTVLLSKEYVETSSGSGLVHCAPGCGPEDYEVGYGYGLIPFNTVDEGGIIRDLGPFSGLRAKKDDDRFVISLEECGALLAKEPYIHEYPYAERSKEPAVFRVTKQWFLRIEDIKDRMKQLNAKVHWVPEWAGANQFHNWIDNLRDNSITKQIAWGTPLPIWRAEDGEVMVIGSRKELARYAVDMPEELHKPYIDRVVLVKEGKRFVRVPDVLDVWVDAGAAAWLALGYPERSDLFERFFPADFIVEGKDQIRGWFNLLAVAGIIAFDTIPFKACYMHGFISDAQGRKMSKSLGNIISPYEVIEKYGADIMRAYLVGSSAPGTDMNYNFEDIEVKRKSVSVLFNMFSLLGSLDFRSLEPITKDEVSDVSAAMLAIIDERIEKVTRCYERYELDSIPRLLDDLYLDLSRNYVQLMREDLGAGDERSLLVARVLAYGLRSCIIMYAPIMPHLCDHLYLEHKQALRGTQDSIHLESWPIPGAYDRSLIDAYRIMLDARAAVLACRDKAGRGIRWPISTVRFVAQPSVLDAIKRFESQLLVQLNVKSFTYSSTMEGEEVSCEPDLGLIGRTFKQESKAVLAIVNNLSEAEMATLASSSIVKNGFEITPQMVSITHTLAQGWVGAQFSSGAAYASLETSALLEQEGYARELARAVQDVRKELGMERSMRAFLMADEALLARIGPFVRWVEQRTNSTLRPSLSSGAIARELTIRSESYTFSVISE